MSDADDLPSLRNYGAFLFICAAAAQVSDWARKSLQLPLITGYILMGILCGPFVLELLGKTECSVLSRIVVSDAMGFIGFSAGSKFLLSEIRGSLRHTIGVLLGQLLLIYPLVFAGVYFLAPWLELTARATPDEVLAISLFIAALAVARSPSSAIALVSELGASGLFTTVSISVTVLIDIVVVFIYAITLLFVRQIMPKSGQAPVPAGFVVGLFFLQIAASCVVGIALGYLLHAIITLTTKGVMTSAKTAKGTKDSAEATASSRKSYSEGPPSMAKPRPLTKQSSILAERAFRREEDKGIKSDLATVFDELLGLGPAKTDGDKVAAPYRRQAALIAMLWIGIRFTIMVSESILMQATGFEVFAFEELEEHAFGRALHQPLVMTMVAGFVIVNFTSSRRPLLRILHDSSELVYIAFFTLTGMTLQLDAVLPNLLAAIVIFTLRLFGIYAGSYLGGYVVGAPAEHTQRYWMTFVTQAGVALGLAQRTNSLFADSFGPALALVVTAEIVLTQLVGPLLFKAAIIAVGEAKKAYSPGNGPDQLGVSPPIRPVGRSGVIVSLEEDAEAEALCSRLESRKWTLTRCDVSTPLSEAGLSAASGQQVERLTTLLNELSSKDVTLAERLRPLLATASSTTPTAAMRAAARAAVTDPTAADPLMQLLWSIASVDSLDVLVLLLPSDEQALSITKILAKSIAPHLSSLHPTQIATPQLIVRLRDASNEEALADLEAEAFELTAIVDRAVMPNLLADILHPQAHWSKTVDNMMPD